MEAKQATARVFVYGTLRSGERNHYVLQTQKAKLIGVDSIQGEVLPTTLGYPCLMHGRGTVQGELYEVPLGALKYLDMFEGAPHLYQREQVNLRMNAGPAWVYFGNEIQSNVVRG